MMLSMMIFLLVIGLILILLELFLPGGIIGSLGGMMILGGIVISFFYFENKFIPVFLTIGVIFLGCILFMLWIKYLPSLPGGKEILLTKTGETWSGTNESEYLQFLGKEGVAQTVLRPSGFVIVEGKRLDVVTEGDMVEPGERVRVTKVEGNRIVVTPIGGSNDSPSKNKSA